MTDDFTHSPNYIDPKTVPIQNKLKNLFKKSTPLSDNIIAQRRHERALKRRGHQRGEIISTVLKEKTLEKVISDIESGVYITAACEANNLTYVALCMWVKQYPELAKRLAEAKAVGKEVRKAQKEGHKKEQKVLGRTPEQLYSETLDYDIKHAPREVLIEKYTNDSELIIEYARRAGNKNFIDNGE